MSSRTVVVWWQKFMQAFTCLVCVAVIFLYVTRLEGSEFSGGRITGPLLAVSAWGIVLLAAGFVLTFFLPQIGAMVILISGLMSLPLFLYFLAPGPFRWVFRGGYSVPATGLFVWDNQSGAGAATLLLAMLFACRTLMIFRRRVSCAD